MLTWRQTTTWTAPSLWRWLSTLTHTHRTQSQPIELCLRHFGYLPARFRHQGELFHVRRVERSWDARAGGGAAPRRYFHVRCADDRCYTLFQDLRAGTWHLVC
jgi:hypothetical protein